MLLKIGDIEQFEYTGEKQETILYPGKYLLEVWGAQGGGSYYSPGGRGGYTKGILTLFQPTHIFIYVGGKGEDAPCSTWTSYQAKGGFNGGGHAKVNGSSRYINAGAGGGGATDIRLNIDDLEHRIIVGGAGGGSGYQRIYNPKNVVGHGGGLEGGKGRAENGAWIEPGTQTSGFAKGQGQSGTVIGWNNMGYAAEGSGGGGGGYYGGHCITWFSSYSNGTGAGGSGYIDTILEEASTVGNIQVGHGRAQITKVGETYLYLLKLADGELVL